MSFLSPFFTDKTLVTILKVVPLNRDVQEEIMWKIIDDMLRDVYSIHMIEEIVNFDNELYYYNNYYAFE